MSTFYNALPFIGCAAMMMVCAVMMRHHGSKPHEDENGTSQSKEAEQ